MKFMFSRLAVFALSLGIGLLVCGDRAHAQRGQRQTNEVGSGATNSGTGATIGLNEFLQFSDTVLNQMLAAPNFTRLLENGARPRIVVGNMVNNTHNDDIRAEDVSSHLREVLANSGLVDVYEAGATDVDVILVTELTSSRIAGPKTEYAYVFQAKLNKPDGLIVGSWSAAKTFLK